jgi:hypothetical protein
MIKGYLEMEMKAKMKAKGKLSRIAILGTVLVLVSTAICSGTEEDFCDDGEVQLDEPSAMAAFLYTIHRANGTSEEIAPGSDGYGALNSSTMTFLGQIAYASERIVEIEDLEAELEGKDYLELSSDGPIRIETAEGLNPDWPQGYTIETNRIIIKLGEADAEERIFTFHEDEWPPIRGGRALLSVGGIDL